MAKSSAAPTVSFTSAATSGGLARFSCWPKYPASNRSSAPPTAGSPATATASATNAHCPRPRRPNPTTAPLHSMNCPEPNLVAAFSKTPVKNDETEKPALSDGRLFGTLIAWLPLFLLPLATFFFFNRLPAWAFMWLLAFALFFASKWLTWVGTARRAVRAPEGRNESHPPVWRHLAYFFLWIGMDPQPFLDPRPRAARPTLRAWTFAFLQTFLGAYLLWGLARRVPAAQPLLAGWIGMGGLIFL